MRKKAESTLSKYIDAPLWNKKGERKQGDSVDGYLLAIEKIETKFGDMKMYILKTESGIVKIAGQSDIRNKIVPEMLNCHIWITFEGLVETQTGAKKSYDIDYDDEDILEEEKTDE